MPMKKILITGGAVYAYLDAVKIISNKFRGGRIAQLAVDFVEKGKAKVTYLCAKDSVHPTYWHECKQKPHPFIKIVHHDGFEDYRRLVKELSPKHDAVILGAAVCNLIPMKPWKKKFPSHNFKPGDRIPIDFTIAPRIIDEVKKVAPKVHLFGFKLLKGVPHKELIEAAYDIVLESKATAVFANDATDLDVRYAVTKEGGEAKFNPGRSYGIVEFVMNCLSDKYYSTVISGWTDFDIFDYRDARIQMRKLTKKHKSKFKKTYGKEKYKFGTIAVRVGKSNMFVTTGRGKKEMGESVLVETVDHRKRKVYTTSKATLNAPLLHKLFRNRPEIKAIVHYHKMGPNSMAWGAYAPAGTARDAGLADTLHPANKVFQIEAHGTFELLEEGDLK